MIKCRLYTIAALLGVVLTCSQVHSAVTAQAKEAQPVIRLTSLNWPPFTSSTQYGGGLTTMILKKAFAQQGYELKVDYLEWDEAVKQAVENREVSGYFPEYYSHTLEKRCVFSEAIGSSLVVLAHRSGEALRWKQLQDLERFKVGVVAGYVNEDAFDKAVAQGKIPSVAVGSDVENLKNLVDKRIDLAVVDRRVLGHWMRKSGDLKPYKREVAFHPAGLKEHGLYVCFTGASAEKNAQVLNDGLKAIDPMGFGLEHDPMYKGMKQEPHEYQH